MSSSKYDFDNLDSDDGFHLDTNLKVALAILSLFFVILAGRVWYLQILHGEEFRAISQKNLFKKSVIYAPRGIIYDRDGKKLVENLPAYKAIVTPQYTTDLEALAKALGTALNIDPTDVVAKVTKSRKNNGPFHPVDVKMHLSRDELFKIELLKIDHAGLDAQEFILRSYSQGKVAAHVLGYVREISKAQIPVLSKKYGRQFRGKDIIGKYGLEENFDSSLRGQNGTEYIIVDAKGRKPALGDGKMAVTITDILEPDPATEGSDLHTTIDSDLQRVAYESFVRNKRVGSLVAISRTGEVLAWVSYPAFDPNEFSKRLSPTLWNKWLTNPDRPLGNKVIQDHYPPGSTFKPIVAVAALQEHILTPNQLVYAPAKMKFGNRTYHDWNRDANKYLDVRGALERSSNVFFYKQGIELGVDRIAKYAKALGLGAKTNIPLNRELPGLIPTKAWKKKRHGVAWQQGESLGTAIGQSFVLTTGIQMAMAYNAIGNGGKVYQPHLIRKIVDRESLEEKVVEPNLVRDLSEPNAEVPVSELTFKTVQEGLFRVVNGKKGTAQRAKLKGPYRIAGKTGTVQVRSFSAKELYKDCTKRPKKYRHHGMFVGYAPADNPEITVAVLTEHSCFSRNAIPIAKDVILEYLKKYKNYVTEDKKKNGSKPKS